MAVTMAGFFALGMTIEAKPFPPAVGGLSPSKGGFLWYNGDVGDVML